MKIAGTAWICFAVSFASHVLATDYACCAKLTKEVYKERIKSPDKPMRCLGLMDRLDIPTLVESSKANNRVVCCLNISFTEISVTGTQGDGHLFSEYDCSLGAYNPTEKKSQGS